MRTRDPLTEVRRICLALPETREKEARGDRPTTLITALWRRPG